MTQEVIDVYNATGDIVVYGKELPREVMYKYSSMVIGDEVAGGKGAKMLDIIEKPATGTEPSNIMGFCRYVLNKEFFDRIFKANPRPNGEYNMTDVLQNMAQDGLASMCLFTGNYFDCGSENGYASANMFVVEHKDELK